jgi:p-cumate 2,3-dioxygenase beta subunit
LLEQRSSLERITRFLFEEAALLDSWRLDEWYQLWDGDGSYEVPSTDVPDGHAPDILMLIDDDMTRLRARIDRLNSRAAHREFPWSKTRHLVTNVIVEDAPEGSGWQHDVTANFAVYRVRDGVDVFFGVFTYRLRESPDGALRIAAKRAELDAHDLYAQGTLSIIL